MNMINFIDEKTYELIIKLMSNGMTNFMLFMSHLGSAITLITLTIGFILLLKNKINSKICLINYSNIETCKSKKYYIVNTSLKINNGIINSLNKLGSGDIILISSSLSLDNLKLLLNEINKQDLQIDYLSKVINENIEN